MNARIIKSNQMTSASENPLSTADGASWHSAGSRHPLIFLDLVENSSEPNLSHLIRNPPLSNPIRESYLTADMPHQQSVLPMFQKIK